MSSDLTMEASTRQPEDSTSADGRTAMESVMSRGFAVR